MYKTKDYEIIGDIWVSAAIKHTYTYTFIYIKELLLF